MKAGQKVTISDVTIIKRSRKTEGTPGLVEDDGVQDQQRIA